MRFRVYALGLPLIDVMTGSDASDEPSPSGAESHIERAETGPWWDRMGFHPNMPESRGDA